MKIKSIGLILIVLMLLTTVSWAASVNGYFKGFPIVKTTVNGSAISSDIPAVNFYSRTLLPVRAISESLGAIVAWDAKTWTANIIKPEVSMILSDYIEEDENGMPVIHSPFAYYDSTGTYSFYEYVDIRGLQKGSYDTRTVIKDSKGNTIYTTSPITLDFEDANTDTGYYLIDYVENVNLAQYGNYKLQFQIMHEGQYKTIFTKTLSVVQGE